MTYLAHHITALQADLAAEPPMASHRARGSIQKPANIILAERVAAKLQEAEELSGILEQVGI